MIEPRLLQQRWVHSHEEDTEDTMVFRPAAFAFPRSRGRESFELRPGGKLAASGPGSTDRREATGGTWALLDGSKLVFHAKGGTKATRELQVLSVDDDRLVVAKPHAG